MQKIELCIFDMDGLLLDTERCLWTVNEAKVLKEMGQEVDEKMLTDVMGGSQEIFKNTILKRYGQDFDYDGFRNKVDVYNREMIQNEKIPVMKGTLELLNYLKSANIEMAVCTSTKSSQAISCLKNAEILDYFDYVVCGDNVKNAKPDPEIYLKPFEHFNINKENAVVFEDAHNGALAAYRAGLQVMLVPDLALLTDEDKEKAFAVLNDLSEAIDIIKNNNK